jgi:N-methylhydantoinase A
VRIATDIGGTFTDLVHLDEASGSVGLAKASTTPPDFERGVLAALKRIEQPLTDVSSFSHGTTVVINALTERKGSKTALITTRGFRDVLEIGRSNRPDLYNLRFTKPQPFVERYLRFEISERVDHRGRVVLPLLEDEVLRAVERMRLLGVEALAICFLHSYANPAHEKRAAEIVQAALPGAFVTMSHEITMEWREYERTNTAVLNAFVQGAASTYITKLRNVLSKRGIGEGLYIMRSNGGTMSFERALQTPIHMVESGPVAGVIGATVVGELTGTRNVITLDIGGTTAKTSLVQGGEPKITTDYRIEQTQLWPGYPIKVPVVDIVEIGAGGGSIAWFTERGSLSVGPRSAGAIPGPACYPHGGTEPTTTDANLLVGRIDPDYFLGGEIAVSIKRAAAALEKIAGQLKIDAETAALGVIRIANNNMINALKLVSIRRGYDPRDFDLVAFGGGGSMHAAALAAELRIGRVIVPPCPAHFCAWGMLMTDLRDDLLRTHVMRTDEATPEILDAIWAELEAEAIERFENEGFPRDRLRFARHGELRYRGQEHTVRVSLPAGYHDIATIAEIENRFHQVHEQAYTFQLSVPIEFVTFHLSAFGFVEKAQMPRLALQDADVERALRGHRLVHFDEAGQHETPIYERERLGVGSQLSGPAVVEDPAASTVVFPDQRLSVDEWGNLIIHTAPFEAPTKRPETSKAAA